MKISPLSILLFLLFQIALTKFSTAQATLQLRSGEILTGKIITIGDLEITYKLPTDLNGPTFVIRKSKVLYITLESGTVINYSNRSLVVSAKRAEQLAKLKEYKNSIKWEILSFVSNDICFGYERHLFRNQSIEFKMAYIGTGNENIERYSSKGFFMKLGYKFIVPSKIFVTSFYGSYLKPEIGYSKFEVDQIHFSSTNLMLNYGFQTLITGRAVVELYGGIGMSYNDYVTEQYVNGIHYLGINRRYFYSNSALYGAKPGFSPSVSGGLILSFFF